MDGCRKTGYREENLDDQARNILLEEENRGQPVQTVLTRQMNCPLCNCTKNKSIHHEFALNFFSNAATCTVLPHVGGIYVVQLMN